MAIISAGYDGTVDEVQFAKMLPRAGGSTYGIDGAYHFEVKAVAGQDRTVSVAPGTAWGHSVVDVMDANVTVQLATVPTGSRWDMIVLRRDWQPTNGNTSVVVIKGGASKTLPSRNNNPGVLDDQPLALVKVTAGQTQPVEIADLRVWARNGGATANNDLVRSYLDDLGTVVEVNKTVWRRKPGHNNVPTWVDDRAMNDTDWATTGFKFVTAKAQWTISDYRLRRKNGRLEGRMRVVLRGFGIIGHSNEVTGNIGNFTDRLITTFPEGYRPTAFNAWPVYMEKYGTQQWFGRLQSNGSLVITHGLPEGYLGTGDELTCYFDVPLD